MYEKVGREEKALSMYTDLRMFDLVRKKQKERQRERERERDR